MRIIDFHSHVLPGIDDGSKDLDMTREMLTRIKASGVDTVIATPHFYGSRRSQESFLERRAHAIEKVRILPTEEIPELFFGAEVAFYSGLEDNDVSKLCIEGTNTMLLEMPFSVWTDFELNEVESLCIDHKLDVVIAHLERYIDFEPEDMVQRLLKLPVYVQINAESVIPWRSRKPWLKMFKDGDAKLLGSDCHNLTSRAPNLAEGRAVIEKKLGRDVLKRIDVCANKLIEPKL